MTEQMYNNSGVASVAPIQIAPKLNELNEFAPVVVTAPTPTTSPSIVGNAAITITINPQSELKAKRIKVLRVLAVKTAAILDWNLLKFETE